MNIEYLELISTHINYGKYLRIVDRVPEQQPEWPWEQPEKLIGISLDHNLQDIRQKPRCLLNSVTDNRMYLHVAAINYLPSATLGLSKSTTCKRPRAVRVLIHHHDIHTVSVQIHWEQSFSVSHSVRTVVYALFWKQLIHRENRLS